MVLVVHVDIFTEIGFNAYHTHIQQRFQQFVLIPVGSGRIGEIDGAGIVECREIAVAVLSDVCGILVSVILRFLIFAFLRYFFPTDIAVLLGFSQLFSTLCDIGQLPKGNAEPIVFQTFQESFRVWKTLRIEFPFTQPVGTEPSRIQMDDVAGIVFLTEALTDIFHFIGREIGHATHPDTETPQRRHRRESRQHAVGMKDSLR